MSTIFRLDVYLFSLSCCQLSIFLANESNFISLHLLAAGLNTDKKFNILFLEERELQIREKESANWMFFFVYILLQVLDDIITLCRLWVWGQGQPSEECHIAPWEHQGIQQWKIMQNPPNVLWQNNPGEIEFGPQVGKVFPNETEGSVFNGWRPRADNNLLWNKQKVDIIPLE